MARGLPPPARRWAISFADLALLIACTLMLGWRPGSVDVAAETRGGTTLAAPPAAAMFVEGEAILTARGALLLGPARSALAGGAQIRVTVGMNAMGSHRLDAWELAAARTAAIARTLGSDDVQLGAPTSDARVRLILVR